MNTLLSKICREMRKGRQKFLSLLLSLPTFFREWRSKGLSENDVQMLSTIVGGSTSSNVEMNSIALKLPYNPFKIMKVITT